MGKTSALRGTNQQIELIGSHSNLARIEKMRLIEKSLHVAQSRRPGERVKGLVGFPKKGDAY